MAINVFAVNGEIPASVVRSLLQGGPMASTASGVAPKSGVITGPANSLVVAATSGMVVSVQPGHAIVAGYAVVNDTIVNKTVEPSTTTARWDVVGLQVFDEEAADGPPSRAEVVVVKGFTTSLPAYPDRFLPLARIVVGASVASITAGNILDLRGYTAAAGGVIPLPGANALNPATVGVAEGQPVWDVLCPGGPAVLFASGAQFIRSSSGGVPMVPLATNPATDLASTGAAIRFAVGTIAPQPAGMAISVEGEVVLTQIGAGGAEADIQVTIEYNVSGTWVAMTNAVSGADTAPATADRQVTIPVRGILPAGATARNPSVGVSVWRLNGTVKRVSHIRLWATPVVVGTGF